MGDESAGWGAWVFDESGAGRVAGSGNLDEAPPEVLPLFPGSLLIQMLARLTPEDKVLALRHKLVPVAFLPGLTVYGAVTQASLHEAERRGLRVVARIDIATYRQAVRRVLGRSMLRHAVNQLALMQPENSARRRLLPEQFLWLVILGLAVLAAAIAGSKGQVLLGLSVAAGIFFAMAVAIRLLALTPAVSRRQPHPAPLSHEDLPVYSVLVPLFRETAVLNQLIGGLMSLNYPVGKLDIKLILEEEDTPMIRAVMALPLPEHFDIIVVPAGKPQTKPRALNYALHFARGSLLTIYDSEDIPDHNQLRQAAAIFAAREDDLACLQAVLTYYNPRENWLTRQFTAEYAALFMLMLPHMASSGLPLPLGGTSNHFRLQALLDAGGWDPFNVTEDADLGYRLSRLGYGTDTFSSRTYEEANTQLRNWMLQRRRWLKGFLQTWLVLMRHPLGLVRETGLSGFWVIQSMTLGVVASALLHPFLLAHAIWFFLSGEARDQVNLPLHGMAIGLNGAVLLLGYAAAMACAAGGLGKLGYRGWFGTIATMPIYWLLLTPAAWLALWDFAVRPHHWHKTEHGLSAMLRRSTSRPAPRRRPRKIT